MKHLERIGFVAIGMALAFFVMYLQAKNEDPAAPALAALRDRCLASGRDTTTCDATMRVAIANMGTNRILVETECRKSRTPAAAAECLQSGNVAVITLIDYTTFEPLRRR